MLPHLGLRMRPEKDFDIVDPETDPRLPVLAEEYHRLVERRGVSPSHARRVARNGSTVLAGLLLRRGDADAMICGAVGRYHTHLRHISQVVGKLDGVSDSRPCRLLYSATVRSSSRTRTSPMIPARAACRDHAPCGRGGAPLRPGTQGRPCFALEFWLGGHAVGAKDAERPGDLELEISRSGGRGRDACGRGPIAFHP